jgi:hypothetical protein
VRRLAAEICRQESITVSLSGPYRFLGFGFLPRDFCLGRPPRAVRWCSRGFRPGRPPEPSQTQTQNLDVNRATDQQGDQDDQGYCGDDGKWVFSRLFASSGCSTKEGSVPEPHTSSCPELLSPFHYLGLIGFWDLGVCPGISALGGPQGPSVGVPGASVRGGLRSQAKPKRKSR